MSIRGPNYASRETRMKNVFFAVVVLLYSLQSFGLTPPPPSPKCSVKGKIKEVQYLEADKISLSPGLAPLPARYSLLIKIEHTTYVEGDTSLVTCDKLFPKDSLQKITVFKERIHSGDSFQTGQSILGDVKESFVGGRYFHSYQIIK